MRGAQSTIVLEHGPMRCTLVPDLGGAIAALTHHGRPVLRSSEGPDDVLQTACFPLVPFANRIEGGRFAFGGRDIVLEVAPEGAPHALHGHGWRSGWAVEQVTARSAVLRLDYAAAGWPWPYAAWQRLCLTSCELLVELTIENRHRSAAMPAGLGLHPYFPRTPATRIACAATHEWRNDPTGLAVSPAPSALFTGGEVPLELLAGRDNFFASPAPSAVIADAGTPSPLPPTGPDSTSTARPTCPSSASSRSATRRTASAGETCAATTSSLRSRGAASDTGLP